MNNYYRIDSRTVEDDATIFGITLIPDYRAYTGHFPGNPVSPGVCSIQMIKECAELLTDKRLFLGYIAQCRFTAIITPTKTPQLQIRMQISETEEVYKVRATVFDETTNYIDFKGNCYPKTEN